MARNTWVQLYNEDPRGLSTNGLTVANTTTSSPIFPTIVFPANYFKSGRLIHLRARAEYGTTTGSPTLTFRLQNTVGTTVTLVTSAAYGLGASANSNNKLEFDIQVQCRTEGTSGTLLASGDVAIGSATASISSTIYLPAVGTAAATATVDTTIAQTWGLEAAWSAANASNTITGIILELKTIN